MTPVSEVQLCLSQYLIPVSFLEALYQFCGAFCCPGFSVHSCSELSERTTSTEDVYNTGVLQLGQSRFLLCDLSDVSVIITFFWFDSLLAFTMWKNSKAS